ncbi:metallophosphoesterase [Craurococcus roseus]|uniref:Metallophosphoesterase n=1 Tax=Craurococcus roseus TaxID=77585 RepID=A0ABP3R6X6_9PROT
MNFALAHLSDLHLPIPAGASRPLTQFTGKRLLAYLAWLRKRSGNVRPEALLADLAAHAADHVAVTGDLTNLALPREFAAARDWLARLGPPERATVVPGNHDATAPVPWERGAGLWRPWMAGDDGAAGPRLPFLRRRGPVALIGLDSAVPTPPGSASGRLGEGQLARLPALLEAAGREGLFRVVLVHHPPFLGPGGWRRALRDRAALREALARSGAELVLHGHHHAALRTSTEGPAGPIPVLGAPHARRAAREPAGWLLHGIARDGDGGWRLDTAERLWDAEAGVFRTARRWTVRISSGAGPRCGSRPGAA